MSDSSNDAFIDFLLFMVVLIGGGFIVAYVVSFLWPILLFYIVPFLVCSGFVYWLLKAFTSRPSENQDDEFYLKGRYNYRALVILYPILIVCTLVVFNLGATRAVYMDKKGKPKSQSIEWPKLHNTYNSIRKSSYESKYFKSLNKLSKKEVVFDRQELGLIVWFSLFLGGPLLYLFFTREEYLESIEIDKAVKSEVKYEKDKLQEKDDNLDKLISKGIQDYKDAYLLVVKKNEALAAQIVDLKTKLEYSSTAPKPSSFKGSGVLDNDDVF